MTERRYATPQALRQAIADRLRAVAAQRSDATLGDLHRRFAYDRLLARVFTADPDQWVLKWQASPGADDYTSAAPGWLLSRLI